MKMHVLKLDHFVSGACGVCGAPGGHNRFDIDLRDLVCILCLEETLDAELQGRAWMHRERWPVSRRELGRRVRAFENSGARQRPRVMR